MNESAGRTVPTLELDDIQGTLLRRRPDDYHGVYLLYRIDDAGAAKQSLRGILPTITSCADWESPRPFTLNIAFTYSGLEQLGVPAESLASFSAEFREGMTARKNVLGDTGANDPSNWVPPLGSRDVHIGVLIISEKADSLDEPRNEARRLGGVSLIHQFDVSVPSSGREHFGFRDSIGGPHIRGSTNPPLPGHDEIWPGEFILGYQDESGKLPDAPVPDALGLNGSYLAFRQLHSDVAAFRRYLRDHAKSPDDEELIGAKMIGRWRSGAPLALSPGKDDPDLAADPTRNNDFLYYDDDPHGQHVPHGAHIRRANPRDSLKDSVVAVNTHRLIRRGAAYGPVLPDGVLEDDGAERGIIFVFLGASLSRQFEFIQQVWMNDGDFVGLGTEKDPLTGNHDGTDTYTIPGKPVRRRLTGLPRFVTVRGGEYFYLPSMTAIEWLASLP